jgi:hypothetical protein
LTEKTIKMKLNKVTLEKSFKVIPAPVRLQRRRTKGFKLISPNGLENIYVGRGTKWGNPYLIKKESDRGISLENYEKAIESKLKADPNFLDELKGKNLVCWCGKDVECHADILLELANKNRWKE